jgi:outer membrane protein insertion porin family
MKFGVLASLINGRQDFFGHIPNDSYIYSVELSVNWNSHFWPKENRSMKKALFVLTALCAMPTLIFARTGVPAMWTGEQPIRQGRVPSTAVIEGVEIRGNRRIASDLIKSNLRTKAGDYISLAVVNRDIQTLYSLGYFDDVRVEETTSASGGGIVIFSVREKPLVRAIDYKGIHSITIAEIQQRFRDSKVGLTTESSYSLEKATEAAEVLRTMLVDKGHPEATVGIATKNIPPNAFTVVFVIDEGPSK